MHCYEGGGSLELGGGVNLISGSLIYFAESGCGPNLITGSPGVSASLQVAEGAPFGGRRRGKGSLGLD